MKRHLVKGGNLEKKTSIFGASKETVLPGLQLYFKAAGEVNETISFRHLCYVHNLKNFRSANNLPIEGSKFRLSVSHVSAMRIPQLSLQFLVKDYQALKSMMSSRAAEAAQQYVASKLVDFFSLSIYHTVESRVLTCLIQNHNLACLLEYNMF